MTKKIYTCKNTMFYNSQCLFVEYNDVLKCPWFTLLCTIKENDSVQEIFNLSEIQDLDEIELFEWYINRKHRNIYENFPIWTDHVKITMDNFYENFLKEQMGFSDFFYKTDTTLNFNTTLKTVLEMKDLVKKVVIYSEYDNPHIREDIRVNYKNCTFVSGDFKEAVTSIPNDSTFVFSDINKLNLLAEMKKLDYSSVIICDGYRYNSLPNDKTKLLADVELLKKIYIFKLDFFDNFYNH